MEKFPMTQIGFEKLQKELANLKSVERPAIISAISFARALGDLSENAEYHAAKEKQGFIEGRIAELEGKISHADVIDTKTLSGDTIKFGATVTIVDEETEEEKTYQIVGTDEANITNGLVSYTAPLARGLIGKSVDDFVEIITPNGAKEYTVLKVEYK